MQLGWDIPSLELNDYDDETKVLFRQLRILTEFLYQRYRDVHVYTLLQVQAMENSRRFQRLDGTFQIASWYYQKFDEFDQEKAMEVLHELSSNIEVSQGHKANRQSTLGILYSKQLIRNIRGLDQYVSKLSQIFPNDYFLEHLQELETCHRALVESVFQNDKKEVDLGNCLVERMCSWLLYCKQKFDTLERD